MIWYDSPIQVLDESVILIHTLFMFAFGIPPFKSSVKGGAQFNYGQDPNCTTIPPPKNNQSQIKINKFSCFELLVSILVGVPV